MAEFSKFILTCIFLLLLNCVVGQAHNNLQCSLKIDTILTDKIGDTNYWTLYCTIRNHSKTNMKFWSNECSWTDFLTIDNPEFEIEGFNCDEQNQVTYFIIKARDTRTFALRIYQKSQLSVSSRNVRVGYCLISTKKVLNLNEMINENNFIWSKQVTLLK